jgi:two-component system sensor histidine kinase VanS
MQKIRNILKLSGEWVIKLKSNLVFLKNKILLWSIITPLISLLIGLIILNIFIDGIFQDPFADAFIYICKEVLRMDSIDAIQLYQYIFRNNKSLWVLTGYIIIMFIVFYRALSRFTKYFNEVNAGIDRLLDDKEEDVALSHEIEFIEKKLNNVKHTLRKKELDAQSAEQRKNDLVIYLAHDLKTPLTSVIGYLSLLTEAPDMPTLQRAKYTKIALDKALRLEQLINEFFEITRYNLQTILLNKQEINLSYMLMQMADELYPLLTPSGKTAVVNAEENINIYGDPDKLARVFNNIMKNAIAYGYPNSTINITAGIVGDEAVITFSNAGNTLPSHKLNTIFDKFYRLDEARSSNTGGSGLGLAIAKSIIVSHGGSIGVESSNQITVFTVKLPVK